MNRAAAAGRAQQQGCPPGPGAEGEPGTRRITRLTEAAAYAGIILVLAGGVTAVSQLRHRYGMSPGRRQR
jgi:hypothetical protein